MGWAFAVLGDRVVWIGPGSASGNTHREGGRVRAGREDGEGWTRGARWRDEAWVKRRARG